MDALKNFMTSPARRQWIKGAAFAAASVAVRPTQAWAATGEGLSHNAEAIHQEVSFSSSPKRIYEVLTNAEQFQKVVLLGAAKSQVDVASRPAEISREPGGTFVIFGGHISGRHIELVPNQRIVQAWHEKEWEPGVYSLARFELHEAGAGTKLILTTLASRPALVIISPSAGRLTIGSRWRSFWANEAEALEESSRDSISHSLEKVTPALTPINAWESEFGNLRTLPRV